MVSFARKWNTGFFPRKSRLCFLWDPLLTLSDFRSNFSIFCERPEHVIVGGGLWHLATKMNLAEIENRLRGVRTILEQMSENVEVIFQLQTKSLRYDHGLYGDGDIQNLNFLARKVFRNSKVQIFDSHLKLYDNYSDICKRFNDALLNRHRSDVLSSSERRLDESEMATFWSCEDPNHSPFLLTRHFAQLILNHLSCSKNVK